ncbi:mutarotase [Hymenobacter sp. BT635]|uniref:Mutarotase n=1 Tax=Hymenobacter nitidus TaxID=2880929 RepID=A0ABS8AI97_9BACT|nr:mutarotase [Hymenobacter nitidus]MCB2379219.1 mutarotase [Hymenobacter nitidus]
MMTLLAHYDALRAEALRHFASGTPALDPWLRPGAAPDTRRGLTLLARPPASVTAAIEALLADFRGLEPAQYYYPATDIHLTILSLISCASGFSLDLIDPAAYQAAVREILQSAHPFTIRYAGLTASPGALIVQGFPLDEGLEELRGKVREYFRRSGLRHSIDQRYRLQTAHSTVVRFRSTLQQPVRMAERIRRAEHQFIGDFEVDTVELVFNDWYQRAANTVLLERVVLNRAASG